MLEKLTYDSPITLAELRPRSFGRLYGEELPDTYGIAKYPPRALGILHAAAVKVGFTDVQSIVPAFNPGGIPTQNDWKRSYNSAVLGLSAISRTIDVSLEYGRRCKAVNPNVLVVVGGHHATFDPEYVLKGGADVAFIGEGDIAFEEFLKALVVKGIYKGLPGTAYMEEGKLINNGLHTPTTSEQLSKSPLPIYSEQVLKDMSDCLIESSRGCPYACIFCTEHEFNQGKFRTKSADAIIAVLEMLPRNKMKFWIDDNFTADRKHAKQVLEEVIRRKLTPLGVIQASVEAAQDRELLKLLKRAGVAFICVGYESDNADALKEAGKHASAEANEAAAAAFKEEGIKVLGMNILGWDTDTPESIKKTVAWNIKYTYAAQFSIRGPLVGSKDTAQLKAQNRILSEKYGTNPRHYLVDGYHVLFEPNHFTPLGLDKAAIEAWRQYYSFRGMHWDLNDLKHRLYAAYTIRRVTNDPQTVEHTRFLESIEPPKVYPSVNIPK